MPISEKKFRLGVAVVCLLHASIAIYFAYHLNIWADEASSLYATDRGLVHSLQTAIAEQKQAPLYFWLLSIWRMIDDSLLFARVFSIVCSIGAIVVFARLCKQYLRSTGALLATAFVGLHPFLIFASIEVRVYSMVVLLTAVLIASFLKAFWHEPEPESGLTASRAAFTAVAVVSLYANYYCGFILAALLVPLLIAGKWKAAIAYVRWMLAAGLLFAPLVVLVKSELASRNSGFHDERSVIDGVRQIWNHFVTFVLPTEIYTPPEQSFASWLRVWVIRFFALGAIAAAARYWRSLSPLAIGMAAVAAVIGAFLVAAYCLAGPSLALIRHAAVLFLPLVLALVLILNDLLEDRSGWLRQAFVGTASAVVLGFFVYGIANVYPASVKRGDWANVARFIEHNETSGQPIMVFPVFEALAPRYHYTGPNRILPDREFFDFVRDDRLGSPESLLTEIDFFVAQIPADAESIWLAVGDICSVGESCSPLQKYIEANYTIVIDKTFYLERLYLLRKKAK